MNSITNEFPGLNAEIDGEPVLYLDSAATSLKPKVMIDAISRYYSGVACNVHRGKHFAMEEVSNQYEQVRYNVANLIQCHGNEVVFVSNTTEAINMVASGLELQKDDLVLVSENAHHSNLLPWSSKAKTEIIVSLPNGAIDIEQYERLLQQKPKVVALTHCSNVTGIYIDLERMAALAKSVGAIVLVDAAQSIPHRKVSVKSGNIDFMCFSAHKMLGPNGVGVLYGKTDMLESLVPQTLGGGWLIGLSMILLDYVKYRIGLKLGHQI
ncbi:aminotransferase class V-fold PLP-dependent enzyme [Pseudoalteromonas sp. A22]|uniref:aminotransferase class V-fold PLP-dependent enzyme n=1 Tax=Pseudoalteromonas sp. A22 TaxID=327511 RepID=UPI0020117015|nr:aminotransferase class V-fold PLP-dependent enzyme [Pseudoalteromonas sp. A22]